MQDYTPPRERIDKRRVESAIMKIRSVATGAEVYLTPEEITHYMWEHGFTDFVDGKTSFCGRDIRVIRP